ncbi:MAG: T9SS type A sorting domain-containing protein [Phormidesmis sp. FL-bin-119]|nr:T9SS type A sorting domain-containing protein [Pedobacter sp.]
MEKNFKASSSISPRGNKVIIQKEGGKTKEIVITRDGKESNTLFWNDDIGAQVRSFNFNSKRPGDLGVPRHNGDSLLIDKDIRVFSFEGDSSINFKFNVDSLMSKFEISGLNSNLRKRVITMHREMALGRPGGVIFRGDAPGFGMKNNNSSSFNYSHIDKDGISIRMNIQISDANKDQLKKITGAETIAKFLEVSDLTLFPNFSSGKMTLSFNIASKGNAKIRVLDSDMISIFTNEATNFSGNYVKQLLMPKNGMYYVTVNQNGNWFVKRFVKE